MGNKTEAAHPFKELINFKQDLNSLVDDLHSLRKKKKQDLQEREMSLVKVNSYFNTVQKQYETDFVEKVR